MKKVILVAIVVVAGLSSSCTKAYNCYCTNGTTSSTTTVHGATLSAAESACLAKESGGNSCGIQ
jgi:hypothetical protein